MEFLQNLLISLLGGGSIAALFITLAIKEVCRQVILEELKGYVTKEQMQLERKDFEARVEDKFLTIYAFREFEKRIEEHFESTNRRFADSSKRFDKVDESLEHITNLIIQR